MRSQNPLARLADLLMTIIAHQLKILAGHQRQERAMSQLSDALARLESSFAAEHAVLVDFLSAIPGRINAAVQEALAANPGISEGDLAAIAAVADQLDAEKAEIVSASGSAPAVTEPTAGG